MNKMWKLSRYWNRFAFAIMKLGSLMVWDYTGKNSDILPAIDEYARDMLCNYK